MEIDQDELLKLLEISISEQHFYVEAHHKRIDFYSGLVLALFTGTAFGIYNASEPIHYIYLIIVPILIFAFSIIAIKGTGRIYQRLLESITIRAKIEQMLGFVDNPLPSNEVNQYYWGLEPLIPNRHIESRTKFESSQAFITQHKSEGLQKWATVLFRVFQFTSIALAILLIYFAVTK